MFGNRHIELSTWYHNYYERNNMVKPTEKGKEAIKFIKFYVLLFFPRKFQHLIGFSPTLELYHSSFFEQT